MTAIRIHYLRWRHAKSLLTINLHHRRLTINTKHIIAWATPAIVPSPTTVISIDFVLVSGASRQVFGSYQHLAAFEDSTICRKPLWTIHCRRSNYSHSPSHAEANHMSPSHRAPHHHCTATNDTATNDTATIDTATNDTATNDTATNDTATNEHRSHDPNGCSCGR